MQTFTPRPQEQVFTKIKKTTHKCSRVEGGISSPEKVQGPVSNSNSVGCYRQLNISSLHKQTRRNPLSGDVCSPWKIMTWCHVYQITLMAWSIPWCLNVMADLLSWSNQVQSSEWSLHQQMFKQMCQKWFTPICHSSEPQSSIVRMSSPRRACLGHRCTKHKLLWSHCSKKIRQCNCLVILIAPGWPGMPWF